MNLAATVEIYAGGVGSGCQGPNCGRKGKVGEDLVDQKKWKPLSKEYTDENVYIKHVPVQQVFHSTHRTGLEDITKNEDDMKVVRRYRDKMRDGVRFPLIDVTPMSGDRYRIGDGNHRFIAWKMLGNKKIPVVVWKR